MEDSKIETTENIDFPTYVCKILCETGWKGFNTKQIEDLTGKAVDCQSKIFDLEARNKELEEALQDILDTRSTHDIYDKYDSCIEIAEQALK